ncbi:hypothetical protein RZS08_62485, partial [Arthrospira platensis SPKY1]|nr:hypothetical protein [Arthrospira platensis SPKY1]
GAAHRRAVRLRRIRQSVRTAATCWIPPSIFLAPQFHQRHDIGHVDALASRLDRRQRRGLLHRRQAAAREVLVGRSALALPADLLVRQRTDHLRRHARGQHPWRDLDAGLDEGRRGN